MIHPHITEKIFIATETLMAEQGIQKLSMQKIAHSADISAGTIYLYFKNKDDLLKQLAQRIFDTFQNVLGNNYDSKLSSFEQYCTMWNNLWLFLNDNPSAVVNHKQYHSIPHLAQLSQDAENNQNAIWTNFCKTSIKNGEIVDLPIRVLWNLSIGSMMSLALDNLLCKTNLSDEQKKLVMKCSFQAIAKN